MCPFSVFSGMEVIVMVVLLNFDSNCWSPGFDSFPHRPLFHLSILLNCFIDA